MNATAKSSLPVVRHALRAEQVAADNKVDRMSMWIRNVERECIQLNTRTTLIKVS